MHNIKMHIYPNQLFPYFFAKAYARHMERVYIL